MEFERPMHAEEVAEYLGKSVKAVRRMAREGQIPARKVGRDWYFNRARIAAIVGCADLPIGGTEEDPAIPVVEG